MTVHHGAFKDLANAQPHNFGPYPASSKLFVASSGQARRCQYMKALAAVLHVLGVSRELNGSCMMTT